MKFNITGKIAIILAISIICSIYAQSPCSGTLLESGINGLSVKFHFEPDYPATILTYHWDPNGDGTIDTITMIDSLVWEYEAADTYTAIVKTASSGCEFWDSVEVGVEGGLADYEVTVLIYFDSLEAEGIGLSHEFIYDLEGNPFLR